jgi:hypothetical protein
VLATVSASASSRRKQIAAPSLSFLLVHDLTALPEGNIVSTTAGAIRMHIREFLATIQM